MYIVAGVVVAFVVMIMLVAAGRAAKQQQLADAAPAPVAGNTSMFAKELTADQGEGMVPAAQYMPPEIPAMSMQLPPPPQAQPASGVLVARPDSLDAPPLPPNYGQLDGSQQRDEAMERVRLAKLQQFEEAVKSKTTVSAYAARSSGSSPGMSYGAGAPASREETIARLAAVRQQIAAQTQNDPSAAYKARLQQMQAAGVAGVAGGASGAPGLLQASANSRNDVTQFDKNTPADRWKLDSEPEAPRSTYEIRTGFVIPATLISGMNSDLPGQILAQVSQDVFDTATGKWRLIPQGSRLIGRYSSDVAYGQSRVLIAWQRIVFPDGKAMDIGSMPGADAAGYSGFKDQVNNHYLRVFASAFLMSGVTAGVTYSQRQNQQGGTIGQPSASSALSEALGQQLGQVTAQLISNNMNIAPTLEIRPGYRFNVIVTKDMTFSKPYAQFDY
jgi:type IV secretion system protein VirB10